MTKKFSELDADAGPTVDDIVCTTNDPLGSPGSKKVTIANFLAVYDSTTSTLTNKSIDQDGTGNAITNIADASIKAAAAIDATKIADGTVTSAEFQYVGGVTSDIQAQLNAKGDASKVGTPVDNQIGVWTGDGTIEGTTGLTYDGSNFQLTGDIGITGTRITKGWFTDLEVTNAIVGSVTTNANLTGIVTSVGNATAIADKAISYTKIADGTDGELITWDATGVAAVVAAGTLAQVLTSNGAGTAPTFEDPSGGDPTVEAFTGDDTLIASESGKICTNEGAAGAVAITLPTATAGLNFTFMIDAAQTFTITAAASDEIRFGTTTSAAAGTCADNAIGNSIELVAVNADTWQVKSSVASWTVT